MTSQQVTITAQPADVTNFTNAFAFVYPTVTGLTTQQQIVRVLKDFIISNLNTQSIQNAKVTFNSTVNAITPPVVTLT